MNNFNICIMYKLYCTQQTRILLLLQAEYVNRERKEHISYILYLSGFRDLNNGQQGVNRENRKNK